MEIPLTASAFTGPIASTNSATPVLRTDAQKSRIKSLLIAGVSQSGVASALGVTPATISQLLSEDAELSQEIADARTKAQERYAKHDESIKSLEEKALRQLEQRLTFARTPMEIAKIFQILNNSKRRAEEADAAVAQSVLVTNVQINLPVAARNFVTPVQRNERNEIIEVAGRPLTTMTAAGLQTIRNNLQTKELENAQTVLAAVNPTRKLMQPQRVEDFQ